MCITLRGVSSQLRQLTPPPTRERSEITRESPMAAKKKAAKKAAKKTAKKAAKKTAKKAAKK